MSRKVKYQKCDWKDYEFPKRLDGLNSKFLRNGVFKVYEDGTIFRKSSRGICEAPKFGTSRDAKYQAVTRMENGKQIQEYVHRLVAEVFIANPENKKTVNHLDGGQHKTNHRAMRVRCPERVWRHVGSKNGRSVGQMNKIRLVFNRTGWDGCEVMWTEIKTVEIELPFDNPERGDLGKWELVGGEWLDDTDTQTGGTKRKQREG